MQPQNRSRSLWGQRKIHHLTCRLIIAEEQRGCLEHVWCLLCGDFADLDIGGRAHRELLLQGGDQVGFPPQNVRVDLVQDVRRYMRGVEGFIFAQGANDEC